MSTHTQFCRSRRTGSCRSGAAFARSSMTINLFELWKFTRPNEPPTKKTNLPPKRLSSPAVFVSDCNHTPTQPRLWFTLRRFGSAGVRAYIQRSCQTAKELGERLVQVSLCLSASHPRNHSVLSFPSSIAALHTNPNTNTYTNANNNTNPNPALRLVALGDWLVDLFSLLFSGEGCRPIVCCAFGRTDVSRSLLQRASPSWPSHSRFHI